MFPITSTRLQRIAEFLSQGRLALILDLDETLFQVRVGSRMRVKSASFVVHRRTGNKTTHPSRSFQPYRIAIRATLQHLKILTACIPAIVLGSPRDCAPQAVTIESFAKRVAIARERLAAAGRSTEPAKIAAMEGALRR